MADTSINLLAQSFYSYAVAVGSIAQIQTIQANALAAFAAGEVSSITSITLNSKTTQFQTSSTAEHLLNASTIAIQWWNDGGAITSELPDFRFLAQ